MQATVMEGGMQTSAAPMKRSKAQKNSAARKRKKAAAAAAATSTAGGASPSASAAAANVAVAAAAAAAVALAARATPAPPSPAPLASAQPETGASPGPLAIRAAPAPRHSKKRRRVKKDKMQATAAAAAASLGKPPGAGPAYTHDHRNGAEGATTAGESQRRSAAASGDSVIKTRQPSSLVSRSTAAAAAAATAAVAGASPSPPPAVALTDSTAAGTPGSAEREHKKKKQKNKNKKKRKRKLDATKLPGQDSSSGNSSVSASAERRVPGGETEAPPVPGKRRHENQPPTSPGNPSTDGGRGRGEGREKEKEQEKEEQEAGLSKILERARKKHRQDIGKGRPLLGWDIAALAGFVFGELATLPLPNNGKGWEQGHGGGVGRKMQAQASAQLVALSKGGLGGDGGEGQEGDDGAAVEAAVDAVTTTAEEEHAGQVTMFQFEALIRKEANGFTARRRAACMLRVAAEEEQAGNIEGAEAGCAACLAAWPGFSSGHLKMAQILRARGVSEQRAIRDVEFHLRLALASASKPGTGPEGEEIARTAAERLALLLCQEGRNKEAAKILKRQGFRYRLSTNVLCYPLPRTGPSPAAESEPAEWEKKTPPAEKTRGRDGKKNRDGNAGRGRGGMGGAAGGAGVESGEASEFVSALDGALPSVMLGHLQEAFGSRSRFWSEHGYNSETGTPGYFSYIHSLEGPHQTSIEQVIGRVRALAERSFPAVKEAKFVEWWAHRRPHSSGHQMHFDSDNEGRGGVRNPIVSVVVYVTGDVGGPTLVTTQRLTSKRLADRGWIVHPRVNRVCMFDGGVLHGVIPGRGIPQPPPIAPPGDAAAHEGNRGIGGCNGGGGGGDSEGGGVGPEGVGSDQSGVLNPSGKEDARRDEAARGGDGRGNGGSKCQRNKLNGVDGGGGGGGGTGANPKPIQEREGMRVTWMVAFWRDIQSRPPAPLPTAKTQREASSRPPSGAGAAQPFPQMPHPGGGKTTQASASAGRVAEPTWPTLFRKKPEGWGCCVPTGGSGDPADGMVTPVTPVPVPRVWEDVDGAENRRVGGAVSRLKRLPEYDLCFQGF